MPQELRENRPTQGDNARDHLANERTFLAWMRTSVAIVVFGFAIGRFAVAIRQLMHIQGETPRGAGISVWFGTVAILAGVLLTVSGLLRYRRVKSQLDSGKFKPAGFIVNLVAVLLAMFGLALAVYLVYIGHRM